jgi:hypothetical protein
VQVVGCLTLYLIFLHGIKMKIMKLRISDRLYKSRHRALTCNGKTIHVFVTLFLVFSIICFEISVLTPQNVCVCVCVCAVWWTENNCIHKIYTNNSYENNHCLFLLYFALCCVRYQNNLILEPSNSAVVCNVSTWLYIWLSVWLLNMNCLTKHKFTRLRTAAVSDRCINYFYSLFIQLHSRGRLSALWSSVCAVAQLLEALSYKPEGREFDSRWCHWYFSLTWSFRSHFDPGVDSAFKKNEYQDYIQCVGPTNLPPSCVDFL